MNRYEKGWKYHYRYEAWFKDIVELGNNIYSCKYFNIQKWTIVDLPEIKLNLEEDFCTLTEF